MFHGVFVGWPVAKYSVAGETHQFALLRHDADHRKISLAFGLEPVLHRIDGPRFVIVHGGRRDDGIVEDRQHLVRKRFVACDDFHRPSKTFAIFVDCKLPLAVLTMRIHYGDNRDPYEAFQGVQPMSIDVTIARPEDVAPLRELYRKEMNCQIIHDSWFGRGWTDPYLFTRHDRIIGYGLVGGVRADPKDVITEFYILPHFRGLALPVFRKLAAVGRAKSIETQSNDVLLTLMLYDCADRIVSDRILF